MSELFLDPNIRVYVHLCIAVITFLVCIFRTFMGRLVRQEEIKDLKRVQTSQALQRAQVLLENGHLLVRKSFLNRKVFFCDRKYGFFTIQEAENRKEEPDKGCIKDLRTLAKYCRTHLVNAITTILAGTWIHFTFDNLLSTKVPFFISRQFKAILQSGIDLEALDASWVSSSSWYCMNLCGFPHYCNIVLDFGDDVEEEVPTAAAALLKETIELFQNSRENLEIYQHKWSLWEEFNSNDERIKAIPYR